jgi:hypothetical protein
VLEIGEIEHLQVGALHPRCRPGVDGLGDLADRAGERAAAADLIWAVLISRSAKPTNPVMISNCSVSRSKRSPKEAPNSNP